MSLLEINGVSRGYGSHPVLRDVSLTVNEGDFVSLIGYSGTGKTTLISLLSGLLKPDAGSVKMEGVPVAGPSHERGIVFQNYSLLPWMNVSENIRLSVDQVYPQWTTEKRKEHTEKYIAMVKLTPAANKLPRELSGGMRQRVAVARALAMNPRVLLLDEPLSALDALTRAQLQDEISDIWLRTRTTVIWITNDPDEAILMADRVIPLLPGEAATLGRELTIDLARPRDRRTISDEPAFKAFRADIIGQLESAKNRITQTSSCKVTLPDILPEDVMTRNALPFLIRRGPRRRSDLHPETVEAAL
ncbi:MAG TPA: ABC transporter ATP-binding protein [Verrucomicrobiales bacterium]|jgi:nitrate/nitrite transport system ATP-binding protein|nr:ABC transporter ATP-binding protein [Verrucomicrobiales bacterium]